jgi:hypothetical protein
LWAIKQGCFRKSPPVTGFETAATITRYEGLVSIDQKGATMPNTGKGSACAAVMAAALLVVLLKWRHFALVAAMSSGQLDGRAISVDEMAPVVLAGQTASLRCGGLRFDVPVDATTGVKTSDPLSGIQVKLDGLACRFLPPRGEPQPDELDWAAEFNQQGLDWQAAACRASRRDFSFWMSQEEAESLQERLEAKMFLSLRAERVEVINHKDLAGLLLIWNSENHPRMEFNYFTPDHQINGTILFLADSGDAQTMNAVRAIINSLKIEQNDAGHAGLAIRDSTRSASPQSPAALSAPEGDGPLTDPRESVDGGADGKPMEIWTPLADAWASETAG